jgi:hypothetical protein
MQGFEGLCSGGTSEQMQVRVQKQTASTVCLDVKIKETAVTIKYCVLIYSLVVCARVLVTIRPCREGRVKPDCEPCQA